MNSTVDTELVAQVTEIVRFVAQKTENEVTAHTKILVDLDFDSLKILELLDELRGKMGCELSAHPSLIHVLHSPTTLAFAISQLRPKGN